MANYTALCPGTTPTEAQLQDMSRRPVAFVLAEPATAVTTGDSKLGIVIPPELNGYNLVRVLASVATVSSSGTPTYQIRNATQAVDMLTTKITIDANEPTSLTAATPPVIDTANDDVASGDLIYIDKDVAGTGEKGDIVICVFQLP